MASKTYQGSTEEDALKYANYLDTNLRKKALYEDQQIKLKLLIGQYPYVFEKTCQNWALVNPSTIQLILELRPLGDNHAIGTPLRAVRNKKNMLKKYWPMTSSNILIQYGKHLLFALKRN